MLNEFVSIGMVVKSSIHAKARQRGLGGLSPNVAFKSKVVSYDDEYEYEGGDDDPDEAKYDYSDHMALVSRTFWSNALRKGPRDHLEERTSQEETAPRAATTAATSTTLLLIARGRTGRITMAGL